ncbi:MAG: hypothetical protein HBSAPP03_19600 [Phycisphaerae bacterium]|nr:MAG: hypothetical protein HBSAPP03_19600 [Phycisphaerae bacterium]
MDVVGPGLPFNTGSYGISGNGNVLVGETSLGFANSPILASRYDRTTGVMTNLGALGGGLDQSRATGASYDGAVVVGFSINDFSSNVARAFRWTPAGGMQNLGVTRPGQHHHSEAAAVSADGMRVIGFSYGVPGPGDAFLWTTVGGMSILPSIPGAPSGYYFAYGMNQDASIIVGVLSPSSGIERGVMWMNGQAVDLGTGRLQGTCARAVNDDGGVIVGQVRIGNTFSAGLWRSGIGWEPLESYLLSIGMSVPAGIDLNDATGISRDGRTIVGYTSVSGLSRQSWVATIPSPATLLLCTLVPLARRRSRSAFPV